MSNPAVSDSLVLRAIGGDVQASERIISEFRPLLRMVASRYLRQSFVRRFDESDIVQHACLEAHKSLNSFRGRTAREFCLWMEMILQRSVSSLQKIHRAEMRNVHREWSGVNASAGLSLIWTTADPNSRRPESIIISGERALQVAAALSRIEQPFRRVIEQRFLEGLRLQEIATREESTVGTVAGQLRRGLATLHRLLGPELGRELGVTGHESL